MSLIASFGFVFFFIIPLAMASALPKEFQSIYMFSLFTGYGLIYLYTFFNNTQIRLYKGPFLLAMSFFVFGIINLIVHNSSNYFPIIAPFIGYIGYHYFCKHKINTRLIDVTFIILYIFYYIVYFSIIPSLWFRPGFDEDGIVFDIASSNAIPIALNNILFAYIIINRVQFQKKNLTKISVFAVINSLLCIIQQSRAGILVSLIILLIVFYQYSKSFTYIALLTGAFIISTNLPFIYEFIDIVGDINSFQAIEKDPRGMAQSHFFKGMDLFTFIFGHTNKSYSEFNFVYTYNVFLDIWDRYGFSMIFILLIFFVRRFIYYKKYSIPLLYFVPFFVYAMVESLFLPSYSDCIIYIMLFYKKQYNEV